MRKTIYIGHLASHADPRDLERLLSGVGKVLYFKMMLYDDIIRRHGGYAIAEMEIEGDAARAVHVLDGTLYQGYALQVRAATAEEETAAGHPRMFGTMNMADDAVPPTDA